MGDQESEPISGLELLQSIRRLGREDPEGLRQLVNEICQGAYAGLSRDVLALAKTLGYGDAELLEAVDCCGLIRTFDFLRLEAERRAAEPSPALIM